MPQKVLPVTEAFMKWVDRVKERYNANHLVGDQVMMLLQSKHLPSFIASKRNKPGVEDCIEIIVGHLVIHCWTTYVSAMGAARDEDLGWVVMTDMRYPKKPCLYSFPIRRTEKFLDRLEAWLKAFWEIANHWHVPCVKCKEDPIIRLARNGKMHAVTYACPNGHWLPNPSVYTGVSEESVKFMSGYFQRYDVYQQRDIENGIFRTPMRTIRSGRTTVASDAKVLVYSDIPTEDFGYGDRGHLE
jgi:hypothetical protein